jgi:acyl-CoA dehydrogenase
MDFHVDPADKAFRKQVQDFLKAHLPPDLAWRGQQGFLAGDDDALRGVLGTGLFRAGSGF